MDYVASVGLILGQKGECILSRELILGQLWTVSYQWDWYLDSSGLCRISRTRTWTVVDSVVSIGLVLGQ